MAVPIMFRVEGINLSSGSPLMPIARASPGSDAASTVALDFSLLLAVVTNEPIISLGVSSVGLTEVDEAGTAVWNSKTPSVSFPILP